MLADARRHAPATLRNKEPILSVLKQVFPLSGTILEIASGTGEHARDFASAFPDASWIPSDIDNEALASIDAYRQLASLENLMAPIQLDVTDVEWPVKRADAILCVNMVHIAPWHCCEGLMRGAGAVLAEEGPLVLYGPFSRGGVHTAPSNADFDVSLKRQNADWGVRDMSELEAEGAANGLCLERVVDMPSDNFCLVLRARPSGTN